MSERHSEFPRARPSLAESREVLIPYDPAAGSLTAVRNVLLQSSIAQLRSQGHYPRYVEEIEPRILEKLESNVGPGWIDAEFALAHYEACDRMALTPKELAALGRQVGEHLQATALASLRTTAKHGGYDPWTAVSAISRVWPRMYQGGSTQYVKVGPQELLVEAKGYRLNQFSYFRLGSIAVLKAIFGVLGPRVCHVQGISYNPKTDEYVRRVSWA
jgi:hypothetical protein